MEQHGLRAGLLKDGQVIGDYAPRAQTAAILNRGLEHIQSVPYQVTARWTFYRLLQDGLLNAKTDYRRFLGYSSRARKSYWNGWRPWTLTDDTRQVLIRGSGPLDGRQWVQELADEAVCYLDRWQTQPVYVEAWFEAAAMQSQFEFYANENVSLLAFHGDVSIPAKWAATARLVERWRELRVPIKVFYYGDLDKKGLEIPQSAWSDISQFAAMALDGSAPKLTTAELTDEYEMFLEQCSFERVGLNPEHVAQYDIPENPERPGSYQWEAASDEAAQALIGRIDGELDRGLFADIQAREDLTTDEFREHLRDMDVTDGT